MGENILKIFLCWSWQDEVITGRWPDMEGDKKYERVQIIFTIDFAYRRVNK
jgi:hypothetical protein